MRRQPHRTTLGPVRDRQGLVIAGGQGKWTGKILRFGHMGEVGIDEMAEALQIMGTTLPEFGHAADPEAGAGAAREAFEAALTVTR